MSENNELSEMAKKRLIKDIVNIHKNPLTSEGIYYIHDDTNMTKGYAMIIGPKDTIYQYGYYLFEFIFPYDYPIRPPYVTFKTYDKKDKTRMHPNLYSNGKVCLSIINTWAGEKWTSCQSIRTILLTIISILDENPLLNEPGYINDINDIRNIKYNKAITYKNIEVAIYNMLSKNFENKFNMFYSFMIEHFKKNYENIIKIINENLENETNTTYIIQIYNQKIITNYKQLKLNIENLNKKLI